MGFGSGPDSFLPEKHLIVFFSFINYQLQILLITALNIFYSTFSVHFIFLFIFLVYSRFSRGRLCKKKRRDASQIQYE